MENSFVTNKDYSFKAAYYSLPANRQKEVKHKIMKFLNLKETSFYLRMNGFVEPKVSEACIIEGIFKQYNILEVWNNNKKTIKK